MQDFGFDETLDHRMTYNTLRNGNNQHGITRHHGCSHSENTLIVKNLILRNVPLGTSKSHKHDRKNYYSKNSIRTRSSQGPLRKGKPLNQFPSECNKSTDLKICYKNAFNILRWCVSSFESTSGSTAEANSREMGAPIAHTDSEKS